VSKKEEKMVKECPKCKSEDRKKDIDVKSVITDIQ